MYHFDYKIWELYLLVLKVMEHREVFSEIKHIKVWIFLICKIITLGIIS